MLSLHSKEVHLGPDMLPPTARANFEELAINLSAFNDKCVVRLSDYFLNLATAPNMPQEERDAARAEWLNINTVADMSGEEIEETLAMLDDGATFTAAMIEKLFCKMTDSKQRLSDMYKSVGLPDEEFERVTGVPRNALIRQCSYELVTHPEDQAQANTPEVSA